MSLEDCKATCNELGPYGCNGIEHWAKGAMTCYRCLNTNQTTTYINTMDQGYPSSVYTKGNKL